RRGMFNIIHHDSIVKVDFIVRKDLPYREEEFARRHAVDIGGATVWMVAPEDLLLSKLDWAKENHSEIQLRDVQNLITAVVGLDWNYIEQWAEELAVSDLLSE